MIRRPPRSTLFPYPPLSRSHSRLDPQAAPSYGLYAPDRRAHLEIVDTNYGVMYAARRNEEIGDVYYWRTTQFLFPIYGMFPGGGEDGTVPLSIYVPIDDEHTLHWGLWWHPSQPMEIGRASCRERV